MPVYNPLAIPSPYQQSSGSNLSRVASRATASANAANERRYRYGLEILDQMAKNIQGAGESSRMMIAERERQGLAGNTAGLLSRGLYNSTVLDSLNRATGREATLATTALDEALNRQRNEVLLARLGFVERRNDTAPDPGLYAQYAQGAAAAPAAEA